MAVDVWASVFVQAALPQRLLMIALVMAILFVLTALALAWPRPAASWRRAIAGLGMAGAGLGLLAGAMTSFHMARTIQSLPNDVTLKQVAPGILEVSSLVGLGATVGLLALIAQGILAARAGAGRPRSSAP